MMNQMIHPFCRHDETEVGDVIMRLLVVLTGPKKGSGKGERLRFLRTFQAQVECHHHLPWLNLLVLQVSEIHYCQKEFQASLVH